ncbi:hypothetical protein BDR07DRAFT_1377039 [Suillus spraguei]|nr:hypothetical protein BDR07DRAFT_1377039 [Suillus spraguei]
MVIFTAHNPQATRDDGRYSRSWQFRWYDHILLNGISAAGVIFAASFAALLTPICVPPCADIRAFLGAGNWDDLGASNWDDTNESIWIAGYGSGTGFLRGSLCEVEQGVGAQTFAGLGAAGHHIVRASGSSRGSVYIHVKKVKAPINGIKHIICGIDRWSIAPRTRVQREELLPQALLLSPKIICMLSYGGHPLL